MANSILFLSSPWGHYGVYGPYIILSICELKSSGFYLAPMQSLLVLPGPIPPLPQCNNNKESKDHHSSNDQGKLQTEHKLAMYACHGKYEVQVQNNLSREVVQTP